MVAHIATYAFKGLEAVSIDVQVQISPGMPNVVIVGLPDKAVGESKERVRAALIAMGLSLPAKRVMVNLSPANITKEGSHYDLPIALGILVAMGVIPEDAMRDVAALGELSLDAQLLSVPGVLPAAVAAAGEGRRLVCPEINGSEARWAGDALSIMAPSSLLALLNHIRGQQVLAEPQLCIEPDERPMRDLKDVKGQIAARRALEIAAAGRHNMLMNGPPGSGKSLLASCLPGILPPLATQEMLETSIIQSISGKLTGGRLSATRPYRDPHHSSSMAAMVGGGMRALPGEISLAHNGVLFLDELPEFPRGVLESLRQPLETRKVAIARAQAHVTYPADFMCIAAMNPCRCGYMGDAGRECGRAPHCGADYQSRLSGPLLDRIDMHVDVPAVDTLAMLDAPVGEPSAVVRARVLKVREVQAARYAHLPRVKTNADLDGEQLLEFAQPDEAGMAMLRSATEKMGLSMRAFNRILRLARTIADMAGSAQVQQPHIAEALSYRQANYGMSRRMQKVG